MEGMVFQANINYSEYEFNSYRFWAREYIGSSVWQAGKMTSDDAIFQASMGYFWSSSSS